MAGIAHPLRVGVGGSEMREPRQQCTGALAATRYHSRLEPAATDRVHRRGPAPRDHQRRRRHRRRGVARSALDVLRAHTSVEVQATGNPGELDGALHRAGSRRIVVAGGDGSLHAVVAALHRRNDLKSAVLGLLPLGTGNDFARDGHPPRHRGGRPGAARRRAPPDGPRRRRGRRGRRQQRARRRRREGQPARRPLEGPAGLGRLRQGQPRQARLPDRRRCSTAVRTRRSCGCASRWTARWSTTSTSRC